MPNPNSVLRRKQLKKSELQVVSETINHYKQQKWKVVDNIESIMIQEPETTFRIFISRISRVLQMYYLGEGEVAKEFSTLDLKSASQVIQEEIKFKELFG